MGSMRFTAEELEFAPLTRIPNLLPPGKHSE